MTWTDLNPEFEKYRGLTPPQVGRKYLKDCQESEGKIYTADLLKRQQALFEPYPEGDPCLWGPPDFPDWYTFWKPVYALKDIPQDEWSDNDWFAYRGLDKMLSFIPNAIWLG